MHSEPADPMGDDDRERAAGEPQPPPPSPGQPFDPSALFVLLRAAPRELDAQMTKLIREFLLTLRSLIDWYLERLDRPRSEPEVEDIPID
jgi:hypothetical protein